jgi:hypothetical protein
MAKKISDYIIKKDLSLVAVDDCKIILDKEDFATKLAVEVDDTIETFGVFIITSADGKSRFKSKFPIVLALNSYDRETTSTSVILSYKKGEIIIDQMGFFKGPKPAIRFLDLLTTGKFDTLNGEDLVNLFINNLNLNGIGSGVQNEIIEVMVSEMVRWKQDPGIAYRLKYGKVAEDDFELMNIKDIARTASVFSAVSFEDVKKAVQSAVLISRTGQKQTYSPIESAI